MISSYVAGTGTHFPAVTWTSAGTAAGEAVLAGIVESNSPSPSSFFLKLHQLSNTLNLPSLQRGNGSIMAQLPAAFNLQQWRMSVCSVDGVGKEECSDATVDLYAPDVKVSVQQYFFD